MGSSHSIPETRKLKCFSTVRKLPETSLNDETIPENYTLCNGAASEVNVSHSTYNSVEANGSCVKKSKGRCWLQKIAKPSSYHSGIRWHQSGDAALTDEFGKSVLHTSRPKSLSIRPVSTSDTKSSQQLNLTLSSDLDLPVFSPVPEEGQFDGSPRLSSSVVQSSRQNETLGRLNLLSPNGTYPLRHRSESSVSRNQYRRRNRMSKLPDILSLDSAVAHETPMTCTLLHYSSANDNNKAFPFLPEGTAYLLSDEQHRSVEQTLCSTKLLLHRLKRVLIENSSHLTSVADQAGNQSLVATPIHVNGVPQSASVATLDLDTSYTTSRFAFDFAPEPTNLADALHEIHRLREDKLRLMEELAKRDVLFQHSSQNKLDAPL